MSVQFMTGTVAAVSMSVEEGDLEVEVNGIPLFYISGESGELVSYCLNAEEAYRLRRLGFAIIDNRLFCNHR